MKNAKLKIVAIVLFTLLLVFVLIMLIFNIIMNQYITKNAKKAIQISLSYETDDELENEDVAGTFLINWLFLDEDYTLSNDELYQGNTSQTEKAVAEWCEKHPSPEGTINYTSINNRQYYVAQLKSNLYDGGDAGISVYYVDVTSEEAIIRQVDIIIAVIMLICGILACFAGVRLGVKIEQEQSTQKKFFENASHELKTPLMSIQGYAEGLAGGIMQDKEHAAKIIMDETDKMATLVDQILCLSKIESQETKLHLESISIDTIINDCLITVEPIALKKGIHFEAAVLPGSVKADMAQFEKAIMNILSNAVRYAKSKISVSYDGKQLVIWNDGTPLSPEEETHIFDRFYTGSKGNTGIGLSLTKEIVELHRWKIYVENANQGTQFVIAFS